MWTKEDWKEIDKLIEDGFITKRFNEKGNLFILNYGQKAQFDSVWNIYTMNSRGHIFDSETLELVTRPFSKFFNYEELRDRPLGITIPELPFDVFDKEDGSLGILYIDEGEYKISTRGSMESDQAKEGTKILKEKYPDVQFFPKVTYLFEIIYPENRIVLDYKGKRDLILLAMIDNETGADIDLHDIGFPMVKKYDGVSDYTKVKELFGDDNMEGFVIRFTNGFRMKIKLEEYVRLHRILTGVNARTIWDVMRNEEDLDSFLEGVPEEFEKWISNVHGELWSQFVTIETAALLVFREIKENIPREIFEDYREYKKLIAKEIFKKSAEGKISKDQISVVFSMIDEKDYQTTIWTMIKPSADRAFNKIGEE